MSELALRATALPPQPLPMAGAAARSAAGAWDYRRWILVLLLVLLLGSAIPSMRIPMLGLQVHAYLLLVAVALLVLPPTRALPSGMIAGSVVFLILVAVWLPLDREGLSWLLRIGAFFATAWVMAHVVVSETDARIALAGTVIVTALMGTRAFFFEWGSSGANALEGISNKNGFSLYSLPAILAGVVILLRARLSAGVRLLVVASVVELAVLTVTSANRSGWVGLALIALISLGGLSNIRSAFLFGLVALGTVVLVPSGTYDGIVRPRFEQTLRPEKSNELRVHLFQAGITVAMENPLTGVGPAGLFRENGARVGQPYAYNSHNVVAFVAGAYGLIALGALTFAVWSLWKWSSRQSAVAPVASSLLRNGLLLLVVRGQFTEQILASPVFAVVIGASLGWAASRSASSRD